MEGRRQIHPVASPNAVAAGAVEATSTCWTLTTAALPTWTARCRRPLMLSLQGLRSEAAWVGVGVEVLRLSHGKLRSFATRDNSYCM